jgi:hypothetical protein
MSMPCNHDTVMVDQRVLRQGQCLIRPGLLKLAQTTRLPRSGCPCGQAVLCLCQVQDLDNVVVHAVLRQRHIALRMGCLVLCETLKRTNMEQTQCLPCVQLFLMLSKPS